MELNEFHFSRFYVDSARTVKAFVLSDVAPCSFRAEQLAEYGKKEY
jgi:hypothetical protein